MELFAAKPRAKEIDYDSAQNKETELNLVGNRLGLGHQRVVLGFLTINE